MKKDIKRTLGASLTRLILTAGFALIALLITPEMFAQSKNEIEKKFDFNGETTEKTIDLDVANGTHALTAAIAGEISDGSLYVTMYDPNGERVNGFSLISVGSKGNYEVHIGEGKNVIEVDDADGERTMIVSASNGEKKVKISENTNDGYSISINGEGSVQKKKQKDRIKIKSKGKKNKNKDENKNVNIVSSDSNGAKGVFVESINDPMPGKWKFVVESKGAKGELELEIIHR